MPRPGQYVIRGEPVVIHNAVAVLPAPSSGVEPNLPSSAQRHERYLVRVDADGAQQLSDAVLWARHSVAGVEQLLGQPNAGAVIAVDEGRGAVFEVVGGDWVGLYLQASLSSGALVTVTVYSLAREQ